MIQKGYKKPKKNGRKGILVVVTEISLIFSGIIMILVPINPKGLSPLPVPVLPSANLPPPLTLPSYETNVLGTEEIDPLDIVKFVNIEREKVGSKPLRVSSILEKGAEMRAAVIMKYQNFSHQDPYENIELLTVLPKLNYRYSYASENIGMGGMTASDFVFGFMHSTYHRINLLDPNLQDTGVAVATGPYKQYYVNIAVQLFAIPGGREEYLGYSFNDTRKYEEQLKELEAELNPVIWFVNSTLGNRKFNEDRKKLLLKHKKGLSQIFEKMQKDLPLTSEDVNLIIEYNKSISET